MSRIIVSWPPQGYLAIYIHPRPHFMFINLFGHLPRYQTVSFAWAIIFLPPANIWVFPESLNRGGKCLGIWERIVIPSPCSGLLDPLPACDCEIVCILLACASSQSLYFGWTLHLGNLHNNIVTPPQVLGSSHLSTSISPLSARVPLRQRASLWVSILPVSDPYFHHVHTNYDVNCSSRDLCRNLPYTHRR